MTDREKEIKEYEELTSIINFETDFLEKSLKTAFTDIKHYANDLTNLPITETEKIGECLNELEFAQRHSLVRLKRLNLLYDLKGKDFKTFKEANGFLQESGSAMYDVPFDLEIKEKD